MAYKRTDRVNALLQRELGQVISEELNDPRIPFATVTAVETTADLRTARVHVSFLADEATGREALATLGRATRHLRRVLGERTELRAVPELVFIEDRSAARAARISSLLRQAREGEEPPTGSNGRDDG